jgi:hypothetical protein
MKKLLFILTVAVAVAGCKKDAKPIAPPSIIGQWNATGSAITFYVQSGDITGALEIGVKGMKFNNDGTVLETFSASPQTRYTYTLTSADGVNYVIFDQADGIYTNDLIRTLDGEKFIVTFDPNGHGLNLTKLAPLKGADDEHDFQTVISLVR